MHSLLALRPVCTSHLSTIPTSDQLYFHCSGRRPSLARVTGWTVWLHCVSCEGCAFVKDNAVSLFFRMRLWGEAVYISSWCCTSDWTNKMSNPQGPWPEVVRTVMQRESQAVHESNAAGLFLFTYLYVAGQVVFNFGKIKGSFMYFLNYTTWWAIHDSDSKIELLKEASNSTWIIICQSVCLCSFKITYFFFSFMGLYFTQAHM